MENYPFNFALYNIRLTRDFYPKVKKIKSFLVKFSKTNYQNIYKIHLNNKRDDTKNSN